MIDKMKLASRVLDDEQLENVAGGNRLETFADGNILSKLGLISQNDALSCAPVRDKIKSFGYKYDDHGGLNDNQYFDKNGNSVSRKEFWKGFAADHPELMKGKDINAWL
ncbi:MAG: hypothetical protein E7200_06890 [Selenomonas ruminantium]|nr:hypothetical protein [Selenomonas ruminantium]